MMQSDYTRKTQALADDRKTFDADKTALNDKNQQLDSSISQLEAIVNDFNKVEIDGMTLEELRDIDPSQYLKVTEQQAARKLALKDAKKLKAETSQTDRAASAQVELSKIVKSNPHWIKDGKETKAYHSEMKQVEDYLTGQGYTKEQQQGVLLGGNGQVYIDAAKYHSGKSSNAAILKKVRKAPITTKPSGASGSTSKRALDKARAEHKKYGSTHTAVKLRNAIRLNKGE
jgi:hypothetical protein